MAQMKGRFDTERGVFYDDARKRMRLKLLKFLVGLLLLPVCLAALPTVGRVLQGSGRADTVWVALGAGALAWVVVFLLLPKPMLMYVFGHELTHALWTWAFGGRVKKFKATSKGGHVIISKSNFIIALAPYFFPLYAAMVILLYVVCDLIWGLQEYRAVFHLLLGAAYAFHVTLTVHILQTKQTDITEQGWLFSFVVIWLGNVAVLIMGIPLLTGHRGMLSALGIWGVETGKLLQRLGQLF